MVSLDTKEGKVMEIIKNNECAVKSLLTVKYPKLESLLLNCDVEFTHNQVESLSKYLENPFLEPDALVLLEEIETLKEENSILEYEYEELEKTIKLQKYEIKNLKKQIIELGGKVNESNKCL